MRWHGTSAVVDRLSPWAVTALAVVVFLPSVTYDFVYDDVYIISSRTLLHSLGNWREILSAPWWDQALYRPLTQILFALEWAVGNGSPVVFHVLNVLLHGMVTLLVYRLGRRVMGRGATVAAAVFAVHPVHVEAVANVVGRAELLSTMFALLAVLAYDRHGDRPNERSRLSRAALGFGVLGALVAGLASKESAFATPGLLLMVDWFRAVEQREPFGARMRRQAPLWFASVLVAAAWLLLRTGILGDVAGDFPAPGLVGLGILGRTVAMAPVVLHYARLFFFPLHLSADYSPDAIVTDAVLTFGGAAGLALAAAVAWLAISRRHRAPSMLLAAAWTGASLFIVANLVVPTGVVLAERTLYMASIGPCWFLGWLVDRVSKRRLWQAAILMTFLLGMAATRSVTRQPVWSEEETLSLSIVFDEPRSYRAKWIAASMAFERGDLALADSLLRGALASFPLHAGVWESLAEVSEARDRWADAAQYYRAANRIASEQTGGVPEYLARATTAFLVADMVDSAEAAAAELWDGHPGTREAKVARADVELARGNWEVARELRLQVAIESDLWSDWWSATEAAVAGGACGQAQRSMGRLRSTSVDAAVRDSLQNLVTEAGC